MIDLTLRVDVLPGSNHDGFGGCDVYEGRLARICVRNPYGYWESVHVAAEVDGEGSGQMQEQRAGAIGESVHIGSWGERRSVGQGLSDVAVGAINIVVFAGEDAVQPVQHMLLNGHGDGPDDSWQAGFVPSTQAAKKTRGARDVVGCARMRR